MKFTTPLTILAAISGAYSLVINKRATPIRQTILDVTASIDQLDAAVNAYNGDFKPVSDAIDDVISVIASGQAIVTGAAPIGLGDAATLLDPVKALENQAKVLLRDVKAHVDDVKAAKQCTNTLGKITTFNTTGQKLVNDIVDKISSAFGKAQAKLYADNIKNTLAQAQDLFEPSNCS